jgi:hypothetical protein
MLRAWASQTLAREAGIACTIGERHELMFTEAEALAAIASTLPTNRAFALDCEAPRAARRRERRAAHQPLRLLPGDVGGASVLQQERTLRFGVALGVELRDHGRHALVGVRPPRIRTRLVGDGHPAGFEERPALPVMLRRRSPGATCQDDQGSKGHGVPKDHVTRVPRFSSAIRFNFVGVPLLAVSGRS